MRYCLASAALLLSQSFLALGDESKKPNEQFFQSLKKFCGQSFEGATEFPQNADHPMVGKKLLMSVSACSESEIRIPLQVGEDKSRTWILTLSDKGLLLKHDHRHPNGTPDKQTNYGGWTTAEGSASRQRFAADEETAKLIPEAATNVWTLEIDAEKQQFTYALERNAAPRYKAAFNLVSQTKEKKTMQAKGTFEVQMTPQGAKEDVPGRMSLEKKFFGDLEAASKGEMLAAQTADGSAGYVAMERVNGTLQGRKGSFLLQHSGTMTRGAPQLLVTVVPDSGTDQLVGLSGKMEIKLADGKHSYEFEYKLPIAH